MPSALETLVKILKLERDNGYKNNAVIGGLAAYGRNWRGQAHRQARRPEHHILVDELCDLLESYDGVNDRDNRYASINYMLDRITGRADAPQEYQSRMDNYVDEEGGYDPDAVEIPETAANVDLEAPIVDRDRPAAATNDGDEADEDDKDEDDDEAKVPRSRRRSKLAEVEDDITRRRRERIERRKGSRVTESASGPTKRPIRRDRTSSFSEDEEDTENSMDWMYGSTPRHRPRNDLPRELRLARPPREPRTMMDPQEAADILRGLNADVETVKGVGPAMAEQLRRLGMETINDLLFFLPRRYDDYTRLTYISKLVPGQIVTIIGTVRYAEVRVGRGGRKDFYAELDDGSGILNLMFFGQHFLVRSIRKGKQIVVSGQTSAFRNRLQMTNPEWEPLDSENLHTVGIVPVYPLTEGLGARKLRSLMKKTVDYWAERLPDYIPEATLDRTEMADLGWAIQNLHFPQGQDHLRFAQNRYIFDQLLTLQLAILATRREWQAVPGPALHITDEFLEGFIDQAFPYTLTNAQRRAIEDIRRDISAAVPMNRLLQGDVGSGKTAVATAVLAMAFSNHKQAAMMAPTSILAEQHYRSLTATFERIAYEEYRPVIALLTGAATAAERESIYRGLADGSIDMVVGTHALIQEGVQFHDLAVVVIDEQHRFGVEQRGALRGKGLNPHLLVMTATPIPRTLALTLYADLDLSVMDEMPPGRTPITTRVVRSVERERIYSFIQSELNKGRQAFIVYPLVEASDKVDALAATDAYDHISQVFFRNRVGLLHGRMKPAEKDDIMADFSNHQFDILVTTAVVEVGVDIPNASVIVIEGANRFGLAQLHQFRGRVGRGGYPSYCLLIPDKDSPEADERLQAMEDTLDGFKLAEIDWKLRGAGDLVGTRQSGRNALQLMELMKPELVEMAQREARTLYEEDPYLERDEHALLRERVALLHQHEVDMS